MIKLINWLKGYLRIRVYGLSVERFMNLCGHKKLLLWDVNRLDDYYEMQISLSAFYKLRPIVKKTQTKVVVLQRFGLPFFMSGLNKRKVFITGCLCSILFWQICGNYIWQIEISGNYRITTEQLSDYLENNQIHIGMRKTNLDIESLEKDLRVAFPDIIWTSGKIDGTCFRLAVKEGTQNGEEVRIEENVRYDLVSPVDGQIYSMIVRNGVPIVKQADMVTKDMVLVEGRVPIKNEDGTVREYKYFPADADITIKYTITYEESLVEKYIHKCYTGRVRKVPFFRFGEKEVSMKRSPSYLVYDAIIQEHTPRLFQDLKIPIVWGTNTYREYLNMESLYTEQEACAILEEKFQQFLSTLSEKGVQIIEKDVKIVKENHLWTAKGEIVIAEPVTKLVPAEMENFDTASENE